MTNIRQLKMNWNKCKENEDNINMPFWRNYFNNEHEEYPPTQPTLYTIKWINIKTNESGYITPNSVTKEYDWSFDSINSICEWLNNKNDGRFYYPKSGSVLEDI